MSWDKKVEIERVYYNVGVLNFIKLDASKYFNCKNCGGGGSIVPINILYTSTLKLSRE
jgi:hypothetical protein